MMQSYVVCNPPLSPLCCSSSRGCFHIQRIVVCAQVQSLLILCWCRDVWLEINVNFDLSSGPKCWLTHCSMYAFTNCVIPWSCKFKANVNVCSLGDNKCLSLRQWNAHVGILPMWSWSCKTPSIGLMFESPCQTIVYGHVSGNGRGHTMWPPPSGNRKLPSCWQGASRREVRQLVLALHQAGGQACSTLIVGILTSWLERL